MADPAPPITPPVSADTAPSELATYQQTRATRRGEMPSGPAPSPPRPGESLVPAAVPQGDGDPSVEMPLPVAVPKEHGWEDPETGEQLDMRTRRGKRIKRLWADREDARREAAQLRQQLLDRTGPPPPQPPAAAASPDQEPTLDQFASEPDPYLAYTRAIARWEVRQGDMHRQQLGQQHQQQQARQHAVDSYRVQAVAARAKYADFDEVTAAPLSVPLSPWVSETILQSPVGADLSYYLATHPEDYARIAQLSPPQAIKALGRLEAQLEPPVAPAPVPVSQAADPITPVSAVGAAPTASADTASMTYDTYRRARATRRGGRP